ncbi:hypothetical protein [Gemmata sp.]|uniref:hypothetical protein n=1 Tax=Gemmata sp. TaxID=1914242 RepID=UPI003F72CA39
MMLIVLAIGLGAPPPVVPDELVPLKARVSGHLSTRMQTLSFTAPEPLTDAQWRAVSSASVKAIAATGRGVNDDALARLAKLPIEALALEHARPTDEGAAAFAKMPSLKVLVMSHCTLTAKAAEHLSNHPSLEVFSDDGKVGGDGMRQIATCRKLRSVRLVHGAANDASTAALVKHPALETLILQPSNTYGVTDTSLASVATIPGLTELTVTHTVLTFEGGLKHLQALPKLRKLTLTDVAVSAEDLAKLTAAVPKLVVSHTPMTPSTRKQWDHAAAKRLKTNK